MYWVCRKQEKEDFRAYNMYHFRLHILTNSNLTNMRIAQEINEIVPGRSGFKFIGRRTKANETALLMVPQLLQF